MADKDTIFVLTREDVVECWCEPRKTGVNQATNKILFCAL